VRQTLQRYREAGPVQRPERRRRTQVASAQFNASTYLQPSVILQGRIIKLVWT
jgi:hypothetical protein